VPFPGVECRGEDVVRIIKDIFRLVSERVPRRVFISVQMHGYITEKDGKLSEYNSWREGSGDPAVLGGADLQTMGTAPKANLPLVKLWNSQRLDAFFTLGSYICYALTGVNATHVTDACASGYYYASNGAVNGYAPASNMPRAYTEVSPVGNYCGCTVYTPVGDHQASYLGSGAEGEYLLNIGTAAQLSCLFDAGVGAEGIEARPYFCEGTRLYTASGLVDGERLFRGEGIDELKKQLEGAITLLPKKDRVLLGGGGAASVFSQLCGFFAERGISCSLAEDNIGLLGLERISKQKRIKAGTMLSEIEFVNFPIIAKNAGLDLVIADNEHGAFDYSFLSRLIMTSRLVGMNCIVRIGDSSRGNVTKLADMGVNGFLLPMCNTAEDIRKVVRYAMYAPIGERGISTTRAHTLYSPPPLAEYMHKANADMKIYAQIETVKGVENCAEILALDGVEGVFIGPNDLSADPGCNFSREKLKKLIIRIADTANAMQKQWGIITADEELTELAVSFGASMISRGSELNMLKTECEKIRRRFR